LDRIVETKRKEVAAARSALSLDRMAELAFEAEPPRDFYAALSTRSRSRLGEESASAEDGGGGRAGSTLDTGLKDTTRRLHLIAEIKKASPSAGVIRAEYDPQEIARTYHQAGVSALSVLTDPTYFQGRLEHIAEVKAVVPLPVLRKDFVIDPYQVYEARRYGADAVLLIAEVLEVGLLVELADLAARLGMTALIEFHEAQRLDAVLAAAGFAAHRHGERRVEPLTPVSRVEPALPSAATGAGLPHRRLLGINNRDLAAQRTDLATAERLAARIPPDVPWVAESGIATASDARRMADAGAQAILVGEALLRADDIARRTRELLAWMRG